MPADAVSGLLPRKPRRDLRAVLRAGDVRRVGRHPAPPRRPRPGRRLLDVACGTGVAPLVGPPGRVVALDLNPAGDAARPRAGRAAAGIVLQAPARTPCSEALMESVSRRLGLPVSAVAPGVALVHADAL